MIQLVHENAFRRSMSVAPRWDDFLTSPSPALRAPPLHSGEGDHGSINYGHNNNATGGYKNDSVISIFTALWRLCKMAECNKGAEKTCDGKEYTNAHECTHIKTYRDGEDRDNGQTERLSPSNNNSENNSK